MQIQKLQKTILVSFDCSNDEEDCEKNANEFFEWIQFLDDQSQSLIHNILSQYFNLSPVVNEYNLILPALWLR